MSEKKLLSTVSKTLIKNVVRHTDSHNKVLEEKEMWKQRQSEATFVEPRNSNNFLKDKGADMSYEFPMRRHDRSAHMDEEPRGTYWMNQLYKAEEADGNRWGHSGYKELYPEHFGEKRRARPISSDRSPSPKRSKHKRSKSKKKKKKSHKKKAPKVEESFSEKDSCDSDEDSFKRRKSRKKKKRKSMKGISDTLSESDNDERVNKERGSKKKKRRKISSSESETDSDFDTKPDIDTVNRKKHKQSKSGSDYGT